MYYRNETLRAHVPWKKKGTPVPFIFLVNASYLLCCPSSTSWASSQPQRVREFQDQLTWLKDQKGKQTNSLQMHRRTGCTERPLLALICQASARGQLLCWWSLLWRSLWLGAWEAPLPGIDLQTSSLFWSFTSFPCVPSSRSDEGLWLPEACVLPFIISL